MKELKDYVEYYYTEENYNCAEAIIHGANECYGLNISSEDMKMFGGYGAGVYAGLVCGALLAGAAILSKMVVVNKAREEGDQVRPVINGFVKNFHSILEGTSCKELRPKYYTPEKSCLKTVMLACEALEKSVSQLKEKSLKME